MSNRDFSNSLDTAWKALADEEQKIIELATQITALQCKISELEENLSVAEISNGENLIQSSISISYELLSAAEVSIPYLTVATLIFTTSKGAYDAIVAEREISAAIDRIVKLRNDLSEEAQATAMTKALIQLINDFDKSLGKLNCQLPLISSMWRNEKESVDMTIDAINAGAIPREMFPLVSMSSIGVPCWNQLAEFSLKLLGQKIKQGQSVTLTTNKSLSAV